MAYFGVLKESPSFGTQIARGLGGGIGTGLNKGLDFVQKMALEKSKSRTRGLAGDVSEEELIEAGLSPEDARLYTKFSTGAKTQFGKDILENRKRGGSGVLNSSIGQLQREMPHLDEKTQPEKEPDYDEELKNSISKQDIGLTPAEKVKRSNERYKTGIKIRDDAHSKLKVASDNKNRIESLRNLSRSKKLPTGLGRLNVDAEGNLKLPFLASPEAQRYVKTFNEFASGAKGTYGSQVTNFDLAQYLKQYPTLLNSKEGIEQLAEQLDIQNDINAIYYKNLQNVYDKAGGARYIDADMAQSLAEKMSEKQVQKLIKKFSQIGTEPSLPAAHKNKGQRFQDEETRDIFISNGREWIKEG